MSELISNHWVMKNREKFFANSAAYVAETPMVGREEAFGLLESTYQSDRPAIRIISEQFGTGKTFFIQNSLVRLVRGGELQEERDVAHLSVDHLSDSSVLQSVDAQVAIVDDLDRRAGYKSVGKAVDAAVAQLGARRLLILIGDSSLKHPDIVRPVIEREELNEVTIPLRPLTQGLLIEALAARAEHQFENQGGAGEEIVREMIEPRVLDALVPTTEPSVATFRDVLGILQEMAKHLPLDSGACRFSIEICRKWADENVIRQTEPLRAQFVEALFEKILRGAITLALTAEEWRNSCGGGDDGSFEPEILHPLVRSEVLIPMGIPFSDSGRNRICGPYLPSVSCFIGALVYAS